MYVKKVKHFEFFLIISVIISFYAVKKIVIIPKNHTIKFMQLKYFVSPFALNTLFDACI